MSGQSGNLTTPFPYRLRPPKRTALLESAEGETKVCGLNWYRFGWLVVLGLTAL